MKPDVMLTGHPRQDGVKFRQITSADGLVLERFYGLEAVGDSTVTLTTILGRGGADASAHNTSGNYYVGVWYPFEGTGIEVDDGEVIIYLSGR